MSIPFKVGLLLSNPTPYRTPMIEKLMVHKDIDLDVYYCAEIDEKRHWDLSFIKNHRIKFLKAWRIRLKGEKIYFQPRIVLDILKKRYDFFMIGGYFHPTMLMAAITCLIKGVHYGFISESHLIRPRSFLKRYFKNIFIRFFITNATASLAVGSYAKSYLIYYGAKIDSIFIFPNTCDVNYFSREAEDIRKDRISLHKKIGLRGEFVILFVGRLSYEKGVDILLKAFRAMKTTNINPELLIVGDGPIRRKLEKTISQKDGIYYIGWIQPQKLPAFYAASDVFVLPSRDEPWGAVVTEAMACGLPVIVTDQVGAAADLVFDGLNGFIIPVDNSKKLFEALSQLFRDKKLREKMGKNSLELIKHWNHEMGIQNFLNAVEYAMSQNRLK